MHEPGYHAVARANGVYKLTARRAHIHRLVRFADHYRAVAAHGNYYVPRAFLLQGACACRYLLGVGQCFESENFAQFKNIGLYKKRPVLERVCKKFSAGVNHDVYVLYVFNALKKVFVCVIAERSGYAAADNQPVAFFKRGLKFFGKFLHVKKRYVRAYAVYIRFGYGFDFYVYAALTADFYKVVF